MLKLMVCVFLVMPGTIAEPKGHNTTTTTASPQQNILSKFHQSDYKIAYEWCEINRTNEQFLNFQLRTFKYNRTTTAVNVTLFAKVSFEYDVEVIMQAYKFASNEYRLFPLRFQFNLCEAIATGAMGYDKMATSGNFSCPLLKGNVYRFYNKNMDEAKHPPSVPSGRYMIEMQFIYHSTEILVVRDYGRVYRPLD